MKPVKGLDHLENVALELAVADAALFAMLFYENPDVLFVMAAGNDSADNDRGLPSPQYLSRFFPNAITVASHHSSGRLSAFSNRGATSVQIAAMGEMVESSVLSNLRAPLSGTSMAAPKVSGVAARICSENPNLKAVDVRRILEESATPMNALKGKVVTGGKLNPEAALERAKDYQNPVSLPKLALPKKNVLAGKDAPSIKVPPLLTVPKPKKGLKIKLPTPPQPARWITSVAGRANNWRLVMSAGTPHGYQTQSGIGAFPGKWIDQKWSEGKRITQIAGSGFLWNVTMSSGVKGGQRLVGPEFDQNRIADFIGDGYRITALGGWKERWMFVMTSDTGWGKQRYTLPTPMTQSRRSSDDFHYWAFISYSSKDAALAERLHKRLETYGIPRDLRGRPGRDGPVPKKLFPIFRDRDELPLSADLGGTLQDALRKSRFLIVICSPAAAGSKWVNEEIRYFKSLGRDHRVIAVIVGGENARGERASSAECFPSALCHRVDAEGEITNERISPIAGDLRKGGDGWTRTFLKCVAGITGLGFDAFIKREQKRARRRRLAIGAMALMALAAGLWSWDFYRVKVSYFAEVVERRGVPVGVIPLTSEQV